MTSPDQRTFSQERAPSPEEKRYIYRRILRDLTEMIGYYESSYTPHGELMGLRDKLLTSERYARFEAWVGEILEEGSAYHEAQKNYDMSSFAEEMNDILVWREALRDLTLGRPLSAEICQQYALSIYFKADNEFFLGETELPDWTKLPSEDELKKTFNLDVISDGYREGTELADPNHGFYPTEFHLAYVGYNDPEAQESLLNSINRYMHRLPDPPRMQVFDIEALINEKAKNQPRSRAAASTREVLEAFDAAGVRPATLKELLLFSQLCWRPEGDAANPLTQEEKHLQQLDTPQVFTLGSVLSPENRGLLISCLRWENGKRMLWETALLGPWTAQDRFLVVPKECI